MAEATLKDALESIAAEGQQLKEALIAAQSADVGAQPTDSLLLIKLRAFRDLMSVSHFKANAMVDVMQIALGRQGVDDIPPLQSR